MVSHPVQASDRIAFAEMGLRTRVYSRLLDEKKLGIADEVERHLWPFAPGAKNLRRFLRDSNKSRYETESESTSFQDNIGEAIVNEINNSTDTDFQEASIELRKNLQNQQVQHPQKGIVISLGRNNLRFATQFLNILRNNLKSTLPVEFYYYGDDDLPFYMRAFLESLHEDVRCIDLEQLQLFDPTLSGLSRQGWALKPFSLLATNFTEAILVDADVVFLADPEELFYSKGYQETGTLFFHDRDHFREGASIIIQEFMKSQLGDRGPSEYLRNSKFWKKKGIYQQESGVVVVDKRRKTVFSALFFTAWQNTGSIRDKTTYRVFWGDKETYWLAFELAGFPYYFVDHYAGGFSNAEIGQGADGNGEFCSSHPMHFLPTNSNLTDRGNSKVGKPFWFNGSILKDKDRSDVEYLSSTTWAIDAEWKFYEDTERWCMPIQGHSGTLADFGLESLFKDIVVEASKADLVLKTLENE